MKRFLFFTVLFSLISFVASAQWIEQSAGFTTASRGIRNFSIVDANIVWASAYDGSGSNANIQEFTKTVDGGATWTPGTIDVGNTGLGIGMIHARSATKAYVVAYANAAGQTQGIFVTEDGGATWTRQTTADYQGSTSFSNVVYFWNDNDGFCMGDPLNGEYELYTTTDGGTTWVAVDGANIPDPISTEYGYAGEYATNGDNIWFSTNKGRIYHSTDKGYTWTVAQTPVSDFGGTNMSATFDFSSATKGLIVDNNNNLYETTDGGDTWTDITNTGHYSTGIAAIPGMEGTYVNTGNSAGTAYTNFNGHAWSALEHPAGAQLLKVSFLDASTGWVGSFNDTAGTGVLHGGIFKFDGTIVTPNANDLAVTALISPSTLEGVLTATEHVQITITNMGTNPQSSYSALCAVNGISIANDAVTTTINPGESIDYTFTAAYDFSTMDDYTIGYAVSLANDEDTSNDSAYTTVQLFYPKNILHEQFTTEECPNCPPVLAYFDEMHDKYGDRLISMTHHSGYGTDFLTNEAAGNMLEFFNVGEATFAPAGMFDRHYNGLDNDGNGVSPGPVFWNGAPYGDIRIMSRILPGYVKVDIDGLYDPITRRLTVDVTGDFVKDFTGDLSINVWLTEDHIAHQSQSNAPAGFEHRYTQRAPLTNFIGDLLQSGATDGDTYSQSYVDTLDANWDANNMYIVAFVGDYNATDVNAREIHNVNQIAISTITKLVDAKSLEFKIYPNPTTGLFNIQAVEGSDIEVVNSLGQVVYLINNANSYEVIDLSDNNDGTYFIRVKSNDSVSTKKIIIIK